MPIVWDNESTGTQRTSLQDFAPPLGYTVSKAVGATWADNPITRAYQWGGNLLQNDGEKLDAGAIDSLIKSAGVTDFTLPEGQYSKDAAMSLIERRRQQQIAADVDARTAWDYTYGTPIRALARTATMLADPLNMAAMFVPGLGEEWAAARVADGASQFTTRALQGASQGALGMAALEGVNYPLAKQLHDDYTSNESLLNILTGALMGGALHGIAGKAIEAKAAPEVPPSPAPDVGWRPETAAEIPLHKDAVLRMDMDSIMQNELGYLNTSAAPSPLRTPGQRVTEPGISYPGEGAPSDLVNPGSVRSERTPFVGDFWPNRPTEGGQLSVNEARAAYTKWNTGDELTPREQQFVDYLHDEAMSRSEGYQSTVDELRAGDRTITPDQHVAAEHTAISQMVNDQPIEVQSLMGDRPRLTGPRYTDESAPGSKKAPPPSADDIAMSINAERQKTLADVRDAMQANREHNILDGDGQPAREEPKAASEPEGRVQDAQARAMAAAQEAEAIVRALQERISGEPAGEVKSPVMEAADAQVAKADAQAKALTDIVNCQRVQ